LCRDSLRDYRFLNFGGGFGSILATGKRVGAVIDELTWKESNTVQELEIDDALFLDRVDIVKPGSLKVLIPQISIGLKRDEKLMIVGPSGCGKSSILRIVAGIWSARPACVRKRKDSKWLFLPQQPYVIYGSLRDQVTYPVSVNHQNEDDKITSLLVDVGLGSLLKKVDLNTQIIWENVLSIGEQQRVSFARALYNQPDVSFMDESTSALDLENQSNLMKMANTRLNAIVHIAHRRELIPYHDSVLEVDSKGWNKRVGDVTSSYESHPLKYRNHRGTDD